MSKQKIKIKNWKLFQLEILWMWRDLVDFIVWFVSYPFIYCRHLWNKSYIREDEFHHSLDMDINYLHAVGGMMTEKGKKYMKDLVRRREIAYQRDQEQYNKNKGKK